MTSDVLATTAHQLWQLYSKCLQNPFFLYATLADDELLCNALQEDLPRLITGFLRCAIPVSIKSIYRNCINN